MDWAGFMVERVSGLSLGEYFQKNIFEPMGLKDISFLPSADMQRRLVTMTQRAADGTLSNRDHPMSAPLTASSEADKKNVLKSGGGGCFGTVRDFTRELYICLSREREKKNKE